MFLGKTGLLLLCLGALFLMQSCALKNKFQPMKTYPGINIPDGEYLHYSEYKDNKKYSDVYFVTKRMTNETGALVYRTYCNLIPETDSQLKVDYYTNWPVYFIFDPKTGSVLETVGNISSNVMNNWSGFGTEGLIYWHYKLDQKNGVVNYLSKSLKGSETNSIKLQVKINPAFPSGDMLGGMFFSSRYLDPANGGVLYSLTPQVMKEPMAIGWKLKPNETLTTKAGTFEVKKISVAPADPFIYQLVSPIIKGLVKGKEIAYFVEGSDRKLVVKFRMMVSDMVLEDISIVK